jgi:xyloglucan-specific exo-beta-1,4-glucanase
MRTVRLWSFFALAILPAACLTPPMLRLTDSSGSTSGGSRTQSEPYTWRNAVIVGGGFVSGIIFSRNVKGLVYARTDVGGAYRLDPGNETWQPLMDWVGRDEAHYLGVESLALDPTNPDRVYLAVGLYTKPWAGAGAMLRSKDRGRSWERTDMSIKMGGNEWGRACGERLAVDPNQPSHVLFGSRQAGLLVSEDHGKTWEKRPGLPAGTGDNPIGITAIVFDAKSGKPGQSTPVIYAAVDQGGGSVVRSSDAGKTWSPLKGQPEGMLACHIELDEQGKLWATYGNGPGPNDITAGAVYTLDPKAGTASDVSPLKPSGEDKFGYAGLAVDHTQPGRLLVTTIDRWTRKDEIFFTKDGGKTWRPIVKTARWDVNDAPWAMLHRDAIVPWWMGDIDLDPFNPNHAKIGAGIWSTTNLDQAEGSKPVEFRLTNHGIEESVVDVLVSPPAGAPLLSGVKDFCGLCHEDLDRSPPEGTYNPPCQETSGLDFAELEPNLVVRTGTVWGFSKEPEPNGLLSTDGGKTWQGFASVPPGAKTGGMVAITADGSSIVWTFKHDPVMVSRDRGKTWQKVKGLRASADVPDWSASDLQPAADRVDPKRVVIYDALEGVLYVSHDGGSTFRKGAQALPTIPNYALMVADIEAVPGHSGHLWISTGEKLYRSIDGGSTAKPVESVEASYGVGIGKAAPGARYPTVFLSGQVEGTKGVFRSTDEGGHWVRVSDDDHQYGTVNVVEGDPRVFGRVYLGPPGRGIVVGEPRLAAAFRIPAPARTGYDPVSEKPGSARVPTTEITL